MASVKVLINSETNIILFKRMNQFIVDSHKLGTVPSMSEHKKIFEAEHGVKIEFGTGGFWKHMEFPSDEAYTLAVLKWM